MLKNSFLALVGRVVSLLAKGIVYLVMARRLGAVGQGEFSLALSASVILTMIASVGVDMANSRLAGAKPDKVGALIANTLVWSLLAGGLASGIHGWLYPVLKASLYPTMSVHTFGLLEVLIPIQVCANGLSGIVVGLGRFQVYAHGLALQHVVWLAVTLAIFPIMSPGLVFAGWTAGTMASACYYGWHMFRGYSWTTERALLREQVAYGSRGFIHALATTLNYRLDLFLVAMLLDGPAVGHYAMASVGAELLLYLPRAVGTSLMAQAARQNKEQDPDGMARAFRVTLALLTACVLAGIVVAPVVGPLILGQSYVSMVPPLQVLLVATIPMGLATMASNQLFGCGQAGTAMVGALVGLIGTVVLDAALIPTMGLIGAALASLVAYSLYTASTFRGLLKANACLTLRSLLLISTDDVKMIASEVRGIIRRPTGSAQKTQPL